MYPLLAAAADNTGRNVNLVTVGLLAVAGALTALTVWYWRHTGRSHGPPTTDDLRDPLTVGSERDADVDVEIEPQPASVRSAAAGITSPVPERPIGDTGALDGDVWDLVARAVLDDFQDDTDQETAASGPSSSRSE